MAVFTELQGDSTMAVTAAPDDRHRSSRRAWMLGLVAVPLAAALLILVIGVTSWLPSAIHLWMSDYRTASGEQRTITLPDGSQISLNAETALSVETAGQVRLVQGEAFLEVAPHSTKPFRVMAGAGVIDVRGTAFNVRYQRHRVIVTVAVGVVDISASREGIGATRLAAGWQVSYEGGQVGAAEPADLLKALAWRRGQLVFQIQPLGEIVAEVNRYHPGRILIINPRLQQLMVSGVFETAHPEQVLKALEQTFHIRRLTMTPWVILLY
jgi:transmembrane sensor